MKQDKTDKPSVSLHLLPIDQCDSGMLRNIDRFGKSQLVEAIKPTVNLLRRADVSFTDDSDPELADQLKNLTSAGAVSTLKKGKLADIYVSFCSDPSNMIELTKIHQGLKLLLTVLVNQTEVNCTDADKIMGRKIDILQSDGWQRYLLPEMTICNIGVVKLGDYYFYDDRDFRKRTRLFMVQSVRSVAAPRLLPPSDLEPLTVDTVSADTYDIERFDKSMVSDLNYLYGLGVGGQLPDISASISRPKIAARARKLPMADWNAPKAMMRADDELSRRMLLLSAYLLYQHRHPDDFPDIRQFAREIVKDIPAMLKSWCFSTLLPGLAGFAKMWADYHHRAKLIVGLLCKLIAPAADRWLSLDNLRMRYLCNDDLIDGSGMYTGLFDSSLIKYVARLKKKGLVQKPSRRSYYDDYDDEPSIDTFDDLVFPFVVSWLRMMCATGLVELAADPDIKANDPTEGLRYVRLTPLGRYALGFDKKYEDDEPVATASFDLDDINGIITILDDNSPYEVFLDQIGERIGPRRVRITPQSIVSKSADADRVEANVDKFKKIVCPEPQGVWREILDEALLRAGCSRPIASKLKIVRLNPEVPGLLDYVASEPLFSGDVLKAEDATVIMEEKFYFTFTEMLHRKGYII